MPSVSAEDAPKLKPYMRLADQLGSFAGQLTETGLKSIEISFEGKVAGLNTKPLVAVALVVTEKALDWLLVAAKELKLFWSLSAVKALFNSDATNEMAA